MIRKIKKAKFNDLKNTTAILTFEDDNTAVHQIDDVMREHTSSYLTFLKDGGAVEAFETKAEKEIRLSRKLLVELMTLCDTKQEQAQKLILGEKATPLQLARYDDKYARAKDGEFEDAVNQAIITKYEQARSAIRSFVDLIELFRGAVDDLIKAKSFKKAEELIVAGKDFDASTSIADIQALLA